MLVMMFMVLNLLFADLTIIQLIISHESAQVGGADVLLWAGATSVAPRPQQMIFRPQLHDIISKCNQMVIQKK